MGQARAGETRNAVLLAAAKVFERKGFAAATIADILAQAGVTKGALYFHFASKEALAVAILDYQGDWRQANNPESHHVMQQVIDMSFRFALALQTDPLVGAGVRLALERNTFRTDDPSPHEEWISVIAQMLAQAPRELNTGVDSTRAAEVIVAAVTGVQLHSEAITGRADILHRLEQLWVLLLPGLVPVDVRAELLTRPAA